jgi:hypothetical protein
LEDIEDRRNLHHGGTEDTEKNAQAPEDAEDAEATQGDSTRPACGAGPKGRPRLISSVVEIIGVLNVSGRSSSSSSPRLAKHALVNQRL